MSPCCPPTGTLTPKGGWHHRRKNEISIDDAHLQAAYTFAKIFLPGLNSKGHKTILIKPYNFRSFYQRMQTLDHWKLSLPNSRVVLKGNDK